MGLVHFLRQDSDNEVETLESIDPDRVLVVISQVLELLDEFIDNVLLLEHSSHASDL